MNNPNEVENEIRSKIELGESLEWLQNTKQFQAVIKNSYIIDTLMNKSQDMLDVNPVFRQEALEKIQSVNYLRQHFISINDEYERALEDSKEEIA